MFRAEKLLQLGLPNYPGGSLSDVETRTVYAQGERRMQGFDRRMVEHGVSIQDRARALSALRSSLRSWSRNLMSDRVAAQWLVDNERNPMFEELVARNEARGFTGDGVYQAIIDSSTRSRPRVNDSLGIDPQNPPPLPPLLPPPAVVAPVAPTDAPQGSTLPGWGTHITPDQIEPDAGDEIANVEKVIEQFTPKPPPTA